MAHLRARPLLAALLLPALLTVPVLLSVIPARADLVQHVANGRGQIDWTSGQIKVTGSGAPPEKGTAAARRLLAERAAVVDAYRQLGEIVNGVKVDAETTVKDFVVESDVVRTKMQAFIQGARRAGETRYLSDGSVEVDMVLNLYGQGNLADIIQPQTPRKPPTYSKVEPADVQQSYTGVIVDLQGRGASPAMSPAILDSSGGEIYLGKQNLGDDFADFVVNHGIVAYANSMGEARRLDRAGKNPLVIKAQRVSGKFKADAVLDNHAAQQLLGAEESGQVLTKANVVFVL